ncbi:MAG: tetratricopeptide repeat protein [Pyrinomonadaceae bacterium]|nr:tetratricopeptide repeat protein [Pyrinomonadaceae bacterium]
MKRITPTAILLVLALASTRFVAAQIGNSSQVPRAVANTATSTSTARKNTESPDASAEKTPSANSLTAQKFYEMGAALYASGKIEDAIGAFKQSSKLQPDDPQSHYMLGMAYSKTKAYKESFESFKRAIRSWPDWPQAHFRLGVISYVLGRRAESIKAYNHLSKLESPLANSLYLIIKEDKNQGTTTEGEAASKLSLTEMELVGTAAPGKEAKNVTVDSNPPPRTNVESKKASASLASSIKEPAPNLSAATPTTNTESKKASASLASSIKEPAPNLSNPSAATPTTNAESKKASVSLGSSIKETPPTSRNPPAATEDSAELTSMYRIGVGDVLDIRLLNSFTPRSTLYTVVEGGLIDMAIAGGPIAVAGLTTEDVQALLAAELKRRAVEEGARVSVGVRQYSSHSVVITGLVNNPGTKFLRREAVPLYVIMAEAQTRSDAGRVTIMRSGKAAVTVELSDPEALNFQVRHGDMISVTARPQEFYYIAGRINHPGQKVFQSGITLLQAILAAGGLKGQNENLIEVSREGGDGRLTTTQFKLKEIKAGKIKDPRVQPGDRIEVIR